VPYFFTYIFSAVRVPKFTLGSYKCFSSFADSDYCIGDSGGDGEVILESFWDLGRFDGYGWEVGCFEE
jgi:hypothetical protein